jgi:hypothetical protein
MIYRSRRFPRQVSKVQLRWAHVKQPWYSSG